MNLGGSVLPFLKKKDGIATSGIIMKHRQPDEKPESEEDDKDAAIHACAQDLINAVHGHDVKGAAEAMRSAFEILEQLPHEEIEHKDSSSPHSYDAQNQKAGE